MKKVLAIAIVVFWSVMGQAATSYLGIGFCYNHNEWFAISKCINDWEELHKDKEILSVCVNQSDAWIYGVWITYKTLPNTNSVTAPTSLVKVGGALAGLTEISTVPIGGAVQQNNTRVEKNDKVITIPSSQIINFPNDGKWSTPIQSGKSAAIEYAFVVKDEEFTRVLGEYAKRKSATIEAIYPQYSTDDTNSIVGYKVVFKPKTKK